MEEEVQYFQDHPKVIPLYEFGIVKIAEPYQKTAEEAGFVDLNKAREALEKELAVSRVRPSAS